MVATGLERDIVLRLRNNTAANMLSFTLLYDGEVWRNYTNPPVMGTLTNYVSYNLGATWTNTGASAVNVYVRVYRYSATKTTYQLKVSY